MMVENQNGAATRDALLALADRVQAADRSDNRLDVEVDVALFVPGAYATIRANAAGTKIICTRPDGLERTYWAFDYTRNAENRGMAANSLRARAAMMGEG